MGVYLGSSPISLYLGGTDSGVTIIPTGITVTTPPTKTSYKAGEKLDISGIVVKVKYSDESEVDITSECTFSPTNGSVVYEDTTEIKIFWMWEGVVTFTTAQPITVVRTLSSITLTGPTKTSYSKGDTLNLDGMTVTAHYNSGVTAIVTSYTTSPAPEATLSTIGNITVTVSYSENGVTKTANFSITVNAKIVTWAGGSDEDVAAMIQAAHNGEIKLADYWAVGDIRTVNLNAGQYMSAQTVELVLAHKPTSNYYYGGGEFIINQKDCLNDSYYMNSTNTNSGSFAGSAMASFLNDSSNGYLKMLPSWLRNVLLDAKVITAKTYNGTANNTSTHKVFLPAEKEVFGAKSYCNYTEASALEVWDWFKTPANRIKKINGSNPCTWWERSPYSDSNEYFCVGYMDGTSKYNYASRDQMIAPAMLI